MLTNGNWVPKLILGKGPPHHTVCSLTFLCSVGSSVEARLLQGCSWAFQTFFRNFSSLVHSQIIRFAPRPVPSNLTDAQCIPSRTLTVLRVHEGIQCARWPQLGTRSELKWTYLLLIASWMSGMAGGASDGHVRSSHRHALLVSTCTRREGSTYCAPQSRRLIRNRSVVEKQTMLLGWEIRWTHPLIPAVTGAAHTDGFLQPRWHLGFRCSPI